MDRTVLEPFAELDPSKSPTTLSSSPSLQIQSLSLSTTPDSQTLLYIGTKRGNVILLPPNPPIPGTSSVAAANVLRSVSLGNSPVDSVVILSEIGRLLVLSGGLLFLLDPLLLQPAQKFGSFKGVTALSNRLRFADSASSDPLGDVASWAETARPGQSFLQKLGSGIRVNGTRTRSSEPQREGEGSSCFVAAAVAGKGLVLMEIHLASGVDGDVSVVSKEIQGVDAVQTMVWLDDSIIVGTADGYLLFSIATGQTTPIFSLPESSGPPRLKPLYRSKEVLLLVDNVGVIVNAHGSPVGGSLIFKHAPDSISELSQYVVAAEDGRLKLYRKKTGQCVQSVTISKGSTGSCFVVSDELGSGEIVAVATSYKVICFHKVSAEEQIKDLLRKKYFKEAVCVVEELKSEGEMTKEMLSFVHAQVGFLLLFDLHFEDAVNHFLLSETMQPSEIFPFIMQDPNRWSPLVPRNRYWGLHPPPILLEQVVDEGLVAIQRAIFLKKAGVGIAMDDEFLLNPPSKSTLLESAIKSIIRYLRVSREKNLDSSVQEGVDTLLMYLYRALNLVADMEQLASSQNSCVVEELETLLDDSGHLRTLAFLYASKGIISKALAIWHILARNYSSGLWKDPAIMVQHGSLDYSTNLISGQKAAAIEASKLLEESSDQGLVLQHLGWIAGEDQELAVRILTSRKRVNQLTPGEVLATIDPKKVEIRQRFLQWLIEDEDSDDTHFHTMYAISLAKSAMETVEMNHTIGNLDDRTCNMNAFSVENGEVSDCPIREKLQIFLLSSELYDADEVLDLIEESELWLEKAILNRRLGEEKVVLQILALKLGDCEAAEQYCAEIGRHDAYMQLLDMYLDPQDGKEPMFNAAVRLLHNHGESLDPLQVLEKLSPDMPLQLASDTILRMLRARVHHHLQGQIVRNLSHALNMEAQLARLEERSRQVKINDDSICSLCRTRLGTKLLAMYPDDSVVCYKCYRRQGESTSTSGRNFKEDIIFKPGWLVMRQS